MLLLFSIFVFMTRAQDANFDALNGVAFTCPKGKTPMQNPDSGRAVSNGCSKPGGLDVPGEEDFTFCCDRHDTCYSTCGVGQKFCDNDFKKCMEGMCTKMFGDTAECKQAAGIYFMVPASPEV